MKDLDKFITDVVTKKINEPEEYEMAIRTAFNKHSYKKIHFNKIAVTICSLLILISGFAYATDIKEFISKYLYNFNKGVDTAIENGYFDETKTDYINSEKTETIINGISMDSYNTGIAVNNMLFDDYNLSFTFSINVSENIDVSNLMTVRLNKVLITDENKNILYCDNKELFEEYCQKNNLEYSYYDCNEHYMSSALNDYIVNKDANSNTVDIIFNLINNRQFSYPKSKNLNITIQEIYMGEEDYYANNEPICLKGNWNLFINVNEKFYNRNSVNYVVKDNSYSDINVTQAKLDNTGFTFKCTVKKEPLYDNSLADEEKQELINKYQEYYLKEDKIIPEYITNCYLEDEFGNKYYTPEISIANPYVYDFSTGNLYYKNCFTYTQSAQTDKIKIYFTINLPNDIRNICIELEKEK